LRGSVHQLFSRCSVHVEKGTGVAALHQRPKRRFAFDQLCAAVDDRSMRMLLRAAALAALLLAVTAQAGMAGQDAVTGTARHLGADPPFPVIQVHVNAFADATGLNPRGFLSVDAEGIHSYTGEITCLSVFGNQATVGIQIVRSSDPALIGQGELWSIVDNGSPSDSDRIAGYEITPTPPVSCPPLFFNVSVVAGNYVVRDSTP
jgi:hypothetical protein